MHNLQRVITRGLIVHTFTPYLLLEYVLYYKYANCLGAVPVVVCVYMISLGGNVDVHVKEVPVLKCGRVVRKNTNLY